MELQIVKLLDPIRMTISGTFNPMGAYNAATDYAVGDQVDYNGSSYIMYNNAAAGTVPTNTSYWGLIASKGDTGATGAQGIQGDPGVVQSINGYAQAVVTLTPDDLDDTTTTNKFVTAADITKLSNLSGTNTGDQDLSTYQLKPSEGAFANGDKTKLDGIEALSDVTDATNVAAAGAVMDGDFSTNGLMTRTAAGTYTSRTITGTTNQVAVTNGDGVSGNPTLSLPQDIHTGASPTFAGLTTTGTATIQGTAATNIVNFKDSGGIARVYIDQYSNLYGTQKANFGSSPSGTAMLSVRTNSSTVDSFNIKGFASQTSNYMTIMDNGSANILTLASTGLLTLTGNLTSATDSTYTLGTSSLYWKETYTDRLYLNSTTYLDGSTAGQIRADISSSTTIPFVINVNTTNSATLQIENSGNADVAFVLKTSGTNKAAYINLFSTTVSYNGFSGWVSGVKKFHVGRFGDGAGCNIYTSDGGTGVLKALSCDDSQGTKLYGHLTMSDAKDIVLNTTTGTKIGTATNQKLGFYNATPVVRPSSTPANATDLATALTLVNDLKSKLVTLGLIA